MSFPKGLGSVLPDVPVYDSVDVEFINNDDTTIKVINPTLSNKSSAYLKQNTNTLNTLDSIFNDIHFKPVDNGVYRIEVTGEIAVRMFSEEGSSATNWNSQFVSSEIWLAKNSEAISDSDDVVLIQLLETLPSTPIVSPIDVDILIELDPNESFCLVIKPVFNFQKVSNISESVPIELTISQVESQDIDFEGCVYRF